MYGWFVLLSAHLSLVHHETEIHSRGEEGGALSPIRRLQRACSTGVVCGRPILQGFCKQTASLLSFYEGAQILYF